MMVYVFGVGMYRLQKSLIQQSYQTIKPISNEFCHFFYQSLSMADPSLSELLPKDQDVLLARLKQLVNASVNSMDQLGRLMPAARHLAMRYSKNGVEPQHYDSVGHAFVDALCKTIGDELDNETKIAWQEFYKVLAATMVAAAYPEVAPIS
jgi:hemoglobin-like flavoprotein